MSGRAGMGSALAEARRRRRECKGKKSVVSLKKSRKAALKISCMDQDVRDLGWSGTGNVMGRWPIREWRGHGTTNGPI